MVDGISVGGKLELQEKLRKEAILKKVITSFIGVFPSETPKYLAFVLFDEPKSNINNSKENTGGNTAAPTFSKIVKKISPIIDSEKYF